MKRILLLEDNGPLRRAMERNLADKGFTVVSTFTVGDGLKILESDAEFDLIISDRELPDGVSLGFINRAHQLLPDAPILAMSGNFSDEDKRLAIEAGATVCVEKTDLARSLSSLLREWKLIE